MPGASRLDNSRVTLGRFRREYIEHLGGLKNAEGLVSLATCKRYNVSLRALAHHLGDRHLLRNITSRKLESWAAHRLTKGGLQGKNPRPVTKAGVNSDLRSIKRALKVAAKWGYLEQAPEVNLIRMPPQPPRDLTPEQTEALFKSEGDPDRRRFW